MRMSAAVIAITICLSAHGAVNYLPDRDLLWVTDYPAELPCTPGLLARVDAAFGWGKVQYDEASDTCTIGCSLWVGRNDGSDTWFQVGSPECPAETLIVRGDLRVHPTYLSTDNGEDWRRGNLSSNRLTVGVKDDPSVRARLLIDNSDRAGYVLIVGGPSGYSSESNGGELCVYHSTIAPLGEVRIGEKAAGSNSMPMGGQKLIELIDATVSDVAGLAFGRNMAAATFEGVRFERCGGAVHGTYMQTMTGCTFADCGSAIVGSSRFDIVLRDCTFVGNERNWTLLYKPLIAIDCDIDSLDKGSYSAERGTFFIAKRHVVVQVVDAQGKPVKGAEVRASTPQAPPATEHDLGQAVTDAAGRTPGRDATGALVLSEVLLRAPAEEGGDPRQIDYSYTIEVRAGDRSGRLDDFTPRESWQEVTIEVQ